MVCGEDSHKQIHRRLTEELVARKAELLQVDQLRKLWREFACATEPEQDPPGDGRIETHRKSRREDAARTRVRSEDTEGACRARHVVPLAVIPEGFVVCRCITASRVKPERTAALKHGILHAPLPHGRQTQPVAACVSDALELKRARVHPLSAAALRLGACYPVP